MIKEFNEQLSAMRSLMERMDKHMTIAESKDNKENHLFEAFNGQNLNKLYPKVSLTVGVDHQTKNKQVQILLKGLSPQSVKRVKSSAYAMSDNCVCDNGRGTIELSKDIPYFEVNKKKKDGDATDVAAQDTTSNDDFNLDDELDSLLLNEADDLDFNLDDELADLFADDEDGDETAGQPSNDSADDEMAHMTKVDNDVWKWLNNDYKGVLDLITNKQQATEYDPNGVAELYDIHSLFAQYMGMKKTPDELRILSSKSDNEIIEEVKQALKNGNYTQLASQMITPMNIDAVIWGNQLSSTNAHKLIAQANAYGMNPTMIHGATMWPKYYNRSVNPGARPYYLNGNYCGRHNQKDSGSKGHVQGFNNAFKNAPFIGYDISDTSIIDPAKGDLHQTLPGLENNITGQPNQAALDYIKNVKEQIPQDLVEKAESTNTDGGKARIYNEVLMAYVSEELNGAVQLSPLNDNMDDNTCVATYINNVFKLSEHIISLYNFANPQNAYPLVDALAFSIALYTVGSDRVSSSISSHRTNIKSTWDKEANTLVTNVRTIFGFIRRRIASAFAPLRNKINELLKAQKQAQLVSDENDDVQVAPAANTASSPATNQVNENKAASIESLLNEFICK